MLRLFVSEGKNVGQNMGKMSWLQAEKQIRIHYLYKELTGNTVEGDAMLTEYIRLLAELSN